MKCHIPGQNVKILGRTIHALARFGDEMYLESLPDCILLRTLNSSESAYAMVKFKRPFFLYFNYNHYETEDKEGLKCKISMKSALNAFKSPAHMDKQVDNLEIKLDPDSCKLIFQLKCKQGVVKTHFVSILDCKAMQAVYTKDAVPNRISTQQRVLSEALSNFQSGDDQVTMDVTSQNLLLRNYVDTNCDFTKLIRTQINLKPVEFESYSITTDTIITFTLKEFRAILAFAEALNLPLQIHFETTGKPAVFVVYNESTFEAHFVLATCKPDNATQNSTQTTAVPEEVKKRKNVSKDTSNSKKRHLDLEVSKRLDEDADLFNFVDIPDGDTNHISAVTALNTNAKENCSRELLENGGICDRSRANSNSLKDVDIPLQENRVVFSDKVRTIFRACFDDFERTMLSQRQILVENSDSD